MVSSGATRSVVMGYTEDDLETVRERRVSGQRAKTFADRGVTLYSDSENRQVENDIRRELSQSEQRRRQFVVVASKGF
jgi:hypothetical protein